MQAESSVPVVTPVLGEDVAQEVLQWIGVFRSLSKATIVSYSMQDYDFWGNGVLSDLLVRQLAHGARITVMTTPPQGKSGRNQEFRRKLRLLEDLDKKGAEVYVHPDLHAKAYLFEDDRDDAMLIVGSPNLTEQGFGTRASGRRTLLELALLTGERLVYSSTERFIARHLLGNSGTLSFATWVAKNLGAISEAKGAP